MKTRGMFNTDKPSHLFCCGEEIYTIPAGKEVLSSQHNFSSSVRASVKCPRCARSIILCLVEAGKCQQ